MNCIIERTIGTEQIDEIDAVISGRLANGTRRRIADLGSQNSNDQNEGTSKHPMRSLPRYTCALGRLRGKTNPRGQAPVIVMHVPNHLRGPSQPAARWSNSWVGA